MFDQSKISFSINNLFNSEDITDVFPFNSPTPVGTSGLHRDHYSLAARPDQHDRGAEFYGHLQNGHLP